MSGYIAMVNGALVERTADEQRAIDELEWSAGMQRRAVLAQIAALEATITNRRMREAALSDAGKAWLADVDARIAALRAQL